MDPITLTLVVVILSLIAYAVYHANEANKYWERKGIPYNKPVLFFGNSASLILMNKHFSEHVKDTVKKFPNEPVVGTYDFAKPTLLVKDPDLIEKILVKDFMHFVDRGFPINRRNEYDISLFTMTGKEWRAVRYKLTPLFTTNKLKSMYGSMADCGDHLSELIDKIDESVDVDIKEILGCFAMDVIGSCAYGIDAKNLAEPDNEFRKMGKKSFEFGPIQMIRFLILMNFPKVAKLFRMTMTRRDVGEYFCKIIRDTIDYRKRNDIKRNDFLQMFMRLRDKGSFELKIKDPADDYLRMEPSQATENIEFTDDIMIGNAFGFLNAGFEATAASILLTLYELAKNIKIQEKVREEIIKHVQENGGSLTYDAVRKMTYLEQCVKEALRIYSPVSALVRVCTKDYTLPNGYTIPVGQTVMIPVTAIHHDPFIHPEPNEFKPERFDQDQKLPPCSFMPFGNGPRMCIAMRFAFLEMSYCLARLLINHKFKLSQKMKPFKLSPKSFMVAPVNPILFNISKIAAS